jgi:alpha-L-rhamnosidase
LIFALLLAVLAMPACVADDLERQFSQPLDWARPWVYWFVMDGNLTREGITADLGTMKNAGIGGAL